MTNKCFACGAGGEVRQLQVEGTNAAIQTHSACLFLLNSRLNNNNNNTINNNSTIINYRAIPMAWYDAKCCLCKDTHALCLPCDTDDCSASMHISCALEWNLAAVDGSLHCPQHTTSINNSIEESSIDELPSLAHFIDIRNTPNNTSITSKDVFEAAYGDYDQARLLAIQQLKTHNARLSCEIQASELEIQRKTDRMRQLQLQLAEEEQDRFHPKKQWIRAFLSVLCRIHAHVHQYGWPILELAQQDHQQVDLSLLPSKDASPKEIVEFYAQLAGGSLPELPFQSYFDGVLSDQQAAHLPNLDAFTSRTFAPEYPTLLSSTGYTGASASSSVVTLCDKCGVRNLPATAPVLPKYRDHLVQCIKCSQNYHLSCDASLCTMSVPPSSNVWYCTACSIPSINTHTASSSSIDDGVDVVKRPRKSSLVAALARDNRPPLHVFDK